VQPHDAVHPRGQPFVVRRDQRRAALPAHELEELRERIKVLERIATEGNTLDAAETRRIASEIEKLRDS